RLLAVHAILRPTTRTTRFPYTTLCRSEKVSIRDITHHSVPFEHSHCHSPAWTCREVRSATGHPSFARVENVRPIRRVLSRLASPDRKSTRLNSSHVKSSYAVFSLQKKI